MNKKIAVSVIVPVYNKELYIEQCVRTLQTQTIRNMEFIFVDDCSQDDSMEVVQHFAAIDSRIHIIRNEYNLGSGPSRNIGLAMAQGEYIGMIDPDDWIAEDFYEILYRKAVEDDLDIVKGSLHTVLKTKYGMEYKEDLLNNNIIRKLFRGYTLYESFTWQHVTAIYRHSMLLEKNVKYGSQNVGEDGVFLLQACHAARNFSIENRAVYFYRRHEDSESSCCSHIHYYDSNLVSFAEIIDFLIVHIEDGQCIYRHAENIVEHFLKKHSDIFHQYPVLIAYESEYLRCVQGQVRRLPQYWRAAHYNIRVLFFLLFGINLYDLERRIRCILSIHGKNVFMVSLAIFYSLSY